VEARGRRIPAEINHLYGQWLATLDQEVVLNAGDTLELILST